ncbi:restriction endonuclease [Enterococcus silesiacus]|uniref:Restriction endonuclease n=1 Tax=Enterococcus silesiacus TaxID=332949 RepID=A0A0S3K710_9ENTE|nr:NgoPII family restriction endonuclease [Enterococcus silesiacus]ALS00076.1 restriction endonuclease [Enterococcus silesiacus]OJG91000.1 type II restriction endonuclease NgoPII [Enterococcus silesiacus]
MTTPTTNVLIALSNILQRNSSILTPIFRSNGSANAAGDSLEYFIKDMFCTGASQYQYDYEKDEVYDKYLSWKGNSSNFPDFIVRGGVGVEPKKLNNTSYSTLALNSSYPKDYIYPDSQNLPKIIDESNWEKKEVIYVAGNLNKSNKLISLWFAYGNTMVADRSVYLDLINDIREAVKETDATLVPSIELARARGIDPLKYTNLRMRGMYELQHPHIVFNEYISRHDIPLEASKIFLVLLKKDYENIQDKPDLSEFYFNGQLTSHEIFIDDPNSTENKLEAIIFEGWTR